MKKSETLTKTDAFRVETRLAGRNLSQNKNEPNSMKSEDYDK